MEFLVGTGCQETPVIPDEPYVLDAGDVVEGVVGEWLATGLESASGWLVVSLGYLLTDRFSG